MTYPKITNLRYSHPENLTVDVDLVFEDGGEVLPFTASPADAEQYGRDLYAAAIAGEFGPIAPYVEPEPLPPAVPRQVTRRQGRLALHQAGKLQSVEAAIGGDIEAQIEYEADTWERDNAFLQSMWAQLGGTESELDDLFTLAATL